MIKADLHKIYSQVERLNEQICYMFQEGKIPDEDKFVDDWESLIHMLGYDAREVGKGTVRSSMGEL